MKNKKIVILVCTLFIVTAISVSGQQINIKDREKKLITNPLSNSKWMKTFGGNNDDMGSYCIQTSDGGYILVGSTSSYGSGEEDMWLIKTDYEGRLIWEKIYGGQFDDFGSDVQETSDGGFIITGQTDSYGSGKDDVWLLKTDSNGEKLWDKTFGGILFDGGWKVRESSDGGYIILGSADHTGGPRGDVWLIKTDDSGEMVWDKKFGGLGHNHGASIDFTSDGGYIIIGASYIYGETDSYDVWLIKTDNNGEMQWDKKFNGEGCDFGHDVQQTDDGGFIIIGETNYDPPESNYIWLIKTDDNGQILWDNVFSNYAKDQRAFSIKQTDDNGYIIAGCTANENIFGFNSLMIKTNKNGEEEWSHHLIDIGNDCMFSGEQTTDGGYIFTGYKTSNLKSDVWLIKADTNGNIPISRSRNLPIYRIFNLFPNLFRILEKIFGK